MIGFMQNGSLMIGKFYMEAKETGLNMQVHGLNFFLPLVRAELFFLTKIYRRHLPSTPNKAVREAATI